MRGKNSSGFTLVELLMALSIFSLVAVAIYSTFYVGIRARDKGENASHLFQEARLILDRMATEARNMIRYSPYEFVGKKDALSFPTLARREDHPAICLVTYHLETTRNGESTILKRTEETPSHGLRKSALSSSHTEIGFDYGYRSTSESSLEWLDSWESVPKEAHPAAIRIKLVLTRGDGQTVFFTKVVHVPMDRVFCQDRL